MDFFPPSPLSPPNAGLILTPSKNAVPFVPAKQQQQQQQQASNNNNNNKLTLTPPMAANHAAPSPSPATPTPAVVVVPAQPVTPPTLLSLDNNHTVATPALKTGSQSGAASATPIVSNNCVELYIS